MEKPQRNKIRNEKLPPFYCNVILRLQTQDRKKEYTLNMKKMKVLLFPANMIIYEHAQIINQNNMWIIDRTQWVNMKVINKNPGFTFYITTYKT